MIAWYNRQTTPASSDEDRCAKSESLMLLLFCLVPVSVSATQLFAKLSI